jgi:hypothetical protein
MGFNSGFKGLRGRRHFADSMLVISALKRVRILLIPVLCSEI